jgi:poly-gamma-glutamate system protein
MKSRFRESLNRPRFAFLLTTAILAGVGTHLAGIRGEWPDGETVAAMELFLRSQHVLWTARDNTVDEKTKAELATTDPLRTGLVGVEWSPLTTTPGALAAKRTTAHPLWVAVFRNWFIQSDLNRNDVVAIGASGSFPGMVFAARIAAESLQLRTVMIGSLTSSNYGANLPEMDLAEMDRLLRAAGLLSDPPLAFSPGGQNDAAEDLEPADRQALLDRMAKLGSLAHFPANLETSLAWRDEIMLGSGTTDPHPPKLFVNIGGHSANYGVGAAPLALPAGLITGEEGQRMFGSEQHAAGDGIALRAARRGMPLINVLNIRALAARHGIPFDPLRIPSPATVRMPKRLGFAHRLVAAVLSSVLLAMLVVWRVPKSGPREWFDLGMQKPPEYA